MSLGYVSLSGGLRLHVLDEGQGAAVLMLHSLGSSKDGWALNVPALRQAHCRCIVPDLPGFGESDMPPRYFTVGDYAETLLALLDVLGIPEASVVGTSFGGVLALELAARAPERIRRVVAMAPAGGDRHVLDHALGELLRWIRDDGVPRMQSVDDLRLVTTQPSHEVLALANLNLARSRAFLPALPAIAAWDVAERGPLVRCPTLLIWGGRDALIPPTVAEDVRKHIPGARLVVLGEAGHAAPFDAAEDVNRLLVEELG